MWVNSFNVFGKSAKTFVKGIDFHRLPRFGSIAKVKELILAMPLKPDVSIWVTLPSACQASRQRDCRTCI